MATFKSLAASSRRSWVPASTCWRTGGTSSRRPRCTGAAGVTAGGKVEDRQTWRSQRCRDAWLEYIRAAPKPRKEDPAADEADAIAEGARNSELTSIAGGLRRAGLNAGEMLAVLRRRNKELCDPPLDDEEVVGIARSVAKYPAGPEPRDEGQKVAQALLEAQFAGGEWLRFEADGQFWSWTGTHWAVINENILQNKSSGSSTRGSRRASRRGC